MKKNFFVRLIEIPATIILLVYVGVQIISNVKSLPNEPIYEAILRIIKRDGDMYVWWVERWVPWVSVVFYVLLLLFIFL